MAAALADTGYYYSSALETKLPFNRTSLLKDQLLKGGREHFFCVTTQIVLLFRKQTETVISCFYFRIILIFFGCRQHIHSFTHKCNHFEDIKKNERFLHTIRKVKFLSKNSILTKPQQFHEFVPQFFWQFF